LASAATDRLAAASAIVPVGLASSAADVAAITIDLA
jgi:hypothetical protein